MVKTAIKYHKDNGLFRYGSDIFFPLGEHAWFIR